MNHDYTLRVCAGCVCEIANGESDLSDTERDTHYATLAAYPDHHAVPDEGEFGFSWAPCELCDGLAGDRYAVALLGFRPVTATTWVAYYDSDEDSDYELFGSYVDAMHRAHEYVDLVACGDYCPQGLTVAVLAVPAWEDTDSDSWSLWDVDTATWAREILFGGE